MNSPSIVLPAKMWAAMMPILKEDEPYMSPQQRDGRELSGVVVSLRLRDGSVKERVEVDWKGGVHAEWYAEEGMRAEAYGPPRFTAEDIESWGYYEQVRQPNWRHPLKKIKRWKVRVWADGRLDESAQPR